jgi:hypothetical protein
MSRQRPALTQPDRLNRLTPAVQVLPPAGYRS